MDTKCYSYVDMFSESNNVPGSGFSLFARMNLVDKINLWVDAGIHQDKNDMEFNKTLKYNPSEMNYGIVTHQHADHVSRVPFVVKQGFDGKIYCSKDSATLMPVVLSDALHIEHNRAKRANRSQLFDVNDISKAMHQTVGLENFNQWYDLNDHVRIMMIANGHLVGSAMFVVQFTATSGEQINMLFTGDYAPDNMFYDVQKIPEEIRELPLTIIIESTYGNVDSTDPLYSEKVFVKNVAEHTRAKGSVIIPAFSLGRVQEVLLILKKMQRQKLLDRNIPIYLDGRLAQTYTKMYIEGMVNVKIREFLPAHFEYITTHQQREKVMAMSKQKVVVTTSGMGSYGPAQTWIPHYLWDPKAMIHFTGYCAEGTYGRKLQDTQPGEFVFNNQNGGLLEFRKAQIKFTTEFSKHAKADQLLDLLRKFRNIRSVIVNHGETETKKIFAQRIYSELGIKKIGVISRDIGFRIGEYGIIKTLASI